MACLFFSNRLFFSIILVIHMEDKTPDKLLDDDWEKRTLCSDGNCIGVIGPDGRCKECGKPYDGSTSHEIIGQESEPLDEALAIEDPIENQANIQEDISDSAIDEEWEKRTLCSDGNCIGVIGPNGRCKECGKPCKE